MLNTLGIITCMYNSVAPCRARSPFSSSSSWTGSMVIAAFFIVAPFEVRTIRVEREARTKASSQRIAMTRTDLFSACWGSQFRRLHSRLGGPDTGFHRNRERHRQRPSGRLQKEELANLSACPDGFYLALFLFFSSERTCYIG